ncbi:MAG: ExeM/NucH family extracellular endonuclease [Ottowia sp.]|uniref:ExeM/NucH family extracellular endonuclease n=1 Tax=Ottowia sp. TaxID=1898956 RepID=UPI003C76D551
MFAPTLSDRGPLAAGALVLAALLGMATPALAAPVAFTGNYTQNFDTLATSGADWIQGSTLAGWYLYTGAGADIATYQASDGTSNSGAFYSFGASGNSERALGGTASGGAYFGSPASGAVAGYIAVAATNATSAAINTLTISFNGEQWRNGGNTSAQAMVMQYGLSSDGSFAGVATWTDSLSWNSPVTGSSAASVDGNAAGRAPVSGALSNLNWQPSQTLWLRWIEKNDPGNDHGLAIDDFSMLSGSAASGPTFAISALSADQKEGQGGTAPFTFTVSRDGDTAVAATVNYAVTGTGTSPADAADFGGTLPSGSLAFAAGETSKTITVQVSGDTTSESDEGITVTLSNPSAGSVIAATASGVIRNDDPSNSFTKISAIQGSGAASSLANNGNSYIVQGMLTGCQPGLNGFMLQATRPEEMDSDPATSEGLFVYYGSLAANLPSFMSGGACPVGTTYQVTGKVTEYKGQTELSNTHSYTEVYSGGSLPASVQITVPVASMDVWERYEGMIVEVSSATTGGKLVVSDNYNLGRYGQVTLAPDDLQVQYTETHAPGKAGFDAYNAQLKLSQILLDDAFGPQNPTGGIVGRGGQPLSAANPLRAGDYTDKIVGILDQFVWQSSSDSSSGSNAQPEPAAHETNYRIQPIAGVVPNFSPALRPTAADIPAAIQGAEIKVASANVLNFFSTLGTTQFVTNGGGSIAGRGASNATEYQRQLDKIVANLIGLNADVYGLMEIQNNGFDAPTDATAHNGKSAIKSLVDALNDAAGANTFAYVKQANTGTDAITVAILYKPAKVTPVGAAATPDTGTYDAFVGTTYGNRVPVAQTFQSQADGEKFTVAVNHFKSKGSGTALQGEDTGDGQGFSTLARERAAAHLLQWLGTHPTGDDDADVLLLGDFNAYSAEKTVTDLLAGGFQKVSSGYSYSFDGLWGSLDHIFASSALAASGQVAGVYKWHINAEEPAVLDYNLEYKSVEQQTGFYAADQYRSSDHNPMVIGLNLGEVPPEQFTLPLSGGAGDLSGQFSQTTCRLAGTPALSGTLPAAAPAGWKISSDMLSFTANGCGEGGGLTLTLTYPQALPANAKLWKWGPTHDDATDHWYTVPATISGHTATFTLTDGADGDADLTANGSINDPVVVGVPLAGGTGGALTPVPTLGEWALMLMGLLLAGAAAQRQRRRK